jgi:hypothetical protein
MAVVDSHAHVIVPEILRDAAPDEGWRPAVEWVDGEQVLEFGGRRVRSATREFVDPERILAEQDAVGVDRIVLCPWVPLLSYGAGPGSSARMATASAPSAPSRCRIPPSPPPSWAS